jgi:transposase
MLLPTKYEPPNELDEQIFAATVPPDHYLRRVLTVIDFERCREELASCYSPSQGRPAIEPILLLKLEFLEYHYNLSDRQVVDQARYNMAFRFFLGLSLRSPLPHHTLLTVFRERLGLDKHQKVFDALVAQAREHGLVKDRLRLKDATHIIANIAIPSALHLIAQARQRLLAAVRPLAPERVAQEEARATVIRTITQDLDGTERLLQRVTHLRSIVTWVNELLEAGQPSGVEPSAWQALAVAVDEADKVLTDRENPQAEGRQVSFQDPDARWGQHHVLYAGYLLDLTMDADSTIVTAVGVLPANADEAADATTLLRHEEQTHGNDVQGLSMDGAGFRGARLREWTDPHGLNLEVFVPPRQEQAPTGYFDLDQFTLNEAGDAMTCPAGQTTRQRQRNRNDTGWMFRFSRPVCAACPLLARCLKQLPQKKGRTVSTNDFAAEYAAARAKAQTPAYQEVRRQHWRVERKLGEMVRWHRARRARYRGLWRVRLQGLVTALVVNVKAMVRLLTTPTVRAESVETT